MKKIIFVLLAVMALTYSCKKDVSDIEENQTNIEIIKNNEVINLIKQFETKMQSTLKSGEYIELDSAVWNMEALQNYSYAYPDSSTRDFIVVKSYYTIPVNSSNKVLMNDVQTVNQQMEDSLLYQLSLFPEEVKCMKFWDVSADSVVGSTAYLSATSGFGLNLLIGTYYGFSSDDDWWWGTLGEGPYDPPLGKCDGTQVGVSDGSNELKWRLNNPALQAQQQVYFYYNLEVVTANFTNCYYNEPPQLKRVYSEFYHDHCMENTELEDYLLAADLIINDYNDPTNDVWPTIYILDGEGARPVGKEFVNIDIVDYYVNAGMDVTYFHHYIMSFGVPSYIPPGN